MDKDTIFGFKVQTMKWWEKLLLFFIPLFYKKGIFKFKYWKGKIYIFEKRIKR